MDSSGGVPSSQLIEKVQTAIDPEVNGGEGLGLAPIGHRVTIEAATGTTVNVAFTLTRESSTGWETVKAAVEVAIQRYFDNLIAAWRTVTTSPCGSASWKAGCLMCLVCWISPAPR